MNTNIESLQTAFYIVGIIFMSVMTIIALVLCVTAFLILSKIRSMKKKAKEKFNMLTNWKAASKGFWQGFSRG